jgi:ribonuclease-3
MKDSSNQIVEELRKRFEKIEKSLSLNFKNKDLLFKAFCHRSYLNENPNFYLEHNERLEFLGDAVLELVVTEYLYQKYPNPEGELTTWRAALVNTDMLAKTAKSLEFNEYLLLSQGESKDTGKARKSILANTFESIIGAIYLDKGYNDCKKFIKKNLIVELDNIIEKGLYKDAKSKFQEQAQSKAEVTPLYKVLDEYGPDHDKQFVVGVFLGEELVAQGVGSSKQEAEINAAKKGLEVKNW